MASHLRLPTSDRSSLSFGKRLGALSMITNLTSNGNDNHNEELRTRQALPAIPQLDNDDFLSLFDDKLNSSPTVTETSTRPPIAFELDNPVLPSELQDTPVMDAGLSRAIRRKPVSSDLSRKADRNTSSVSMSYRSSLSSTNPSFRTNSGSSVVLRGYSQSSMTEPPSSSERSSKESEAEDEKVERRNDCLNKSTSSATPLSPKARHVQSPKSPGRGKRLGKAMADGVPTSPRSSTTEACRRHDTIPSTPQTEIFATQLEQDVVASVSRVRRTLAHQAPDTVDNIRVGIMSQLDNVDDLISCALVSKDFYSAYVKFESQVVERVIKRQSISAWELRKSVARSDKQYPFRMRPILRDYSTIRALMDFIVWRCRDILRPQTLEALVGNLPDRKSQLEDAMWQIWTFCNVFGKTSHIEASVAKQIQWFEGKYKRASRKGSHESYPLHRQCSMVELEDISEMWRCLDFLLSDFRGREVEARGYGMFDNAGDLSLTDSELLDLWIADILSLGPKAVLTLSSCDFEQANVLGITRWTPPTKPTGRTKFLKAAVEEIYRDRLVRQARQTALDYRKSLQQNHKRNMSAPSVRNPFPATNIMPSNVSVTVPRIDTGRLAQQSMPSLTAVKWQSIESVIQEVRPDCDPLSPIATSEHQTPSPQPRPDMFTSLAMTSTASTRLGPSLFPIENRDQSQRPSISEHKKSSGNGEDDSAHYEDIVDPTDKALALMVQGMGFGEAETRRALMLSDTGSGIDVQKAIGLLSSDETTVILPRKAAIYELPAPTGEAPLSPKSSSKQTCPGSCKPLILLEPKRARVAGLGIVKRGFSYRLSTRRGMKLSVIPDEDEEPMSLVSPVDTSEPANTPTTETTQAISTPASPDELISKPPLHKDVRKVSRVSQLRAGFESPVSPMSSEGGDWPQRKFATVKEARVTAQPVNAQTDLMPRIVLHRVGTGVRRKSWSLPGRRRTEHITKPEVIGYVHGVPHSHGKRFYEHIHPTGMTYES